MIIDMRINTIIGLLLLFTYFGGSNVPSVLSKNKQLLLGLFFGLLFGSSVIYEKHCDTCGEGNMNNKNEGYKSCGSK